MAEVILRVVSGQKAGICVISIDIQRLIGGNQYAGVLLGIASGNFRRIAAKYILEGTKSLGAQFIPVADKKGTPQLTCVCNAFQ